MNKLLPKNELHAMREIAERQAAVEYVFPKPEPILWRRAVESYTTSEKYGHKISVADIRLSRVRWLEGPDP
jgi:hypothetical protein